MTAPTLASITRDEFEELVSPMERACFILLAGGASQKQIAATLRISPHTVNGYTKRLYRKLHIRVGSDNSAVVQLHRAATHIGLVRA